MGRVQQEQEQNSPQFVAYRLMEEFYHGRMDQKVYNEKIDEFESQVRLWCDLLKKIRLGFPMPDEEAAMMYEASQLMELICKGVGRMRAYAPDRQVEVAQEVMDMINSGSQVIPLLSAVTNSLVQKVQQQQQQQQQQQGAP